MNTQPEEQSNHTLALIRLDWMDNWQQHTYNSYGLSRDSSIMICPSGVRKFFNVPLAATNLWVTACNMPHVNRVQVLWQKNSSHWGQFVKIDGERVGVLDGFSNWMHYHAKRGRQYFEVHYAMDYHELAENSRSSIYYTMTPEKIKAVLQTAQGSLCCDRVTLAMKL